jgi:hypothetical protein
MTLPDTFAAKTMTSTCVVWVGSTNSKGYGLISIDGKVQLAHRVAYEAANGPIPAGMVIDHLCRVRNCVKPEHLEVVTVAENNLRGRSSAALEPGSCCINGHWIDSRDDLYYRPSGASPECRECRSAASRRTGGRRPTVQRRAESVVAAVSRVEGKAS